MFKGLVMTAGLAAASLAVSSAALAQGDHLTDSQYISAVRCRALIASPALGKGDTSALDAMIRSEGAARTPTLLDRASEVKSEAARQADRASGDQKARLMAERAGVCESFNTGSATTAAAQMAQPAGAN